jgi:hypothetical protein
MKDSLGYIGVDFSLSGVDCAYVMDLWPLKDFFEIIAIDITLF